MISKILRTFKTLILLAAVFSFAACGRSMNGNMNASEEFKRSLFKEPDQVLTKTLPEKFQTFDVYDVVDVQVAADAAVTSISARVVVSSSAGRETVELVGMIRPDGSASLVDLAPMPDGKNRLVAEASCADRGVCKNIIVNVYFNVGGETKKKQFASAALLAGDNEPAAKDPKATLEVKDAKTEKPEAAPKGHEDEAHESEKELADETDESDTTPGEFVGAPRNEGLINKLYPRSEVPVVLAPTPESEKQPETKPDASNPGSAETGNKTGKTDPSNKPGSAPKPAPKPEGKPAGKSPATPGRKSGGKSTDTKAAPKPTAKPAAKPTPKPTPAKDERGYVERARDWVTSWFVTEEKKPDPKPAPAAQPSKPATPPAQAGRAGSRPQTPARTNGPAAQAGRAQPTKPAPVTQP
ncbi:MAG: hypothetical protein EOP05_18460, partial [Proteobacteria bacterium]